ncbi:MAG: tetratricopeptide repeat protein [Enhygromyxa sp.]
MQAWPRGLRPAGLHASHRGVELCYRTPDDRWFRISAALAPKRPGGVEVRSIPGADPQTTERLARAVELRLRRSPAAQVWLSRARSLIDALVRLQTFGGEGDPRTRGLDELLASVEGLRVGGDELEAGQLDRLEQALANASELLGAGTIAELGIVMYLAAGSFERALELWGRHGAEIDARARTHDDRRALACSAIVHGYLGRVADAHARAIRLAARARDAIDARHTGELLEQLRRPELAAEQLRLAATDSGDGRGAFDVYRRLASVAAQARNRELTAWAAAGMLELASGPDQQLLAATMQREAGEFAAAEATLEQLLAARPEHGEAALLLATLRLWRGDHRSAASLARAQLEPSPDSAAPSQRPQEVLALRILGVAERLGGRSELARELLARVLELDPNDHEARLWYADILDELDRTREAQVEVRAVTLGDHPAWQLVRARIEERDNPGHRLSPNVPWFVIEDNIRQLLGDEAPAGSQTHEQAIDAINRALAKLGGNRSVRLTTPTPATATSPGSLRWLDGVESPRHRAETLQRQAIYRDIDELIAEFEALAAAHPQIPFFVTYPAELGLWRGEYQRAYDRFEHIWQATHTRWGYVGAGAAAMLLGRDEQALALWEEGKRYYAYLDAEATYCYRGELFVRQGELARAREDLELALRARPERLGAWINLALLEHAEGREAPLRAAVARVEELCPPYAWEARREAGLPGPLEASSASLEPDALARWMSTLRGMMRGNRSSVMYTIVDRDQTLRVLPVVPAQLWREYGRRCLSLLEDELLTELAVRRGL